MNIGIITPTYPYNGSAECVFVEALVNEFVSMGHKCTVIAPFSVFTYLQGKRAYGLKYEKRTVNGSSVEIFKPRVFGIKDYAVCGVSNSRYQSALAIERTIKHYKLNFDILYCHFFAQGLSAYRYAKENNIPLFVATGESSIPIFNSPFHGFSLKNFREYLSGTICVSTKNKEECVKKGYSLIGKCIVIPNAVNMDLFHLNEGQASLRDELGLPKDKFLVISVGEFSERKGQNRIIEAIAGLNDSRIAVVLIGKSLSKSFKLISHPSIIFTGPVPHDDLPKYLHASDVFVLPTLREGCCNAIVEAMACGLPIVSSNLPFNTDILDDNNSILVDPNNVNEIGSSIKRIIDDDSLRKKLSKGALDKSKSLSIDNRAKKIEAFINLSLTAKSK